MFQKVRVKKKLLLLISILLLFVMSIQLPWQTLIEGIPLKLQVTLKVPKDDIVQLFFITSKNGQFNEEDSFKEIIKGSEKFQIVNFQLPQGKKIYRIRVDIGTLPGDVFIKSIKLDGYSKRYFWDADKIRTEFSASQDIAATMVENNILRVSATGSDPFFSSDDIEKIVEEITHDASVFVRSFASIAIILICLLHIVFSLHKNVLDFLKSIIKERALISSLAKKDLQNRYLGSYLGLVWAFIQPTVTIFVFWFVFQVGFKSAPVENVPFILWLICGMVPWFFFTESFQGATNSVVDNGYLVKKVVFKVSTLPIIRILSSLYVHLFFVALVFIMFIIYGYTPGIYSLQILYFMLAEIVLVLGLSWITSSLVVFLRDLGQIVSIIIQFGFWMTPIFWSYEIMPEKYRFVLKLNPMYYIVEGYRDSFINHVWFWQRYNQTINFWIITLGLFFVGILFFKRLKPHFADVL